VIAASSPWVSERAELAPDLPPNVTIRRGLDRLALRDLYDRASVIVVPLQPGLDIAAGVNAVLEGMSMRKPVVVTSTPGIADYVRDDETASVVKPKDPFVLAGAIDRLLEDPPLADRIAAAGRAIIDSGRNLDGYVRSLRDVVAELVPLAGAPAAQS
jgi:glycosyltransferase involved in cell wall biosynthesis